jgi:hypothetical protein
VIFHYLLCWVPLNWYFSLDTFLTLFPIYSISITLKFDIMWLHRLTWLMPLSYKLHSHSFVMLWQHLNIKTSLPPFKSHGIDTEIHIHAHILTPLWTHSCKIHSTSTFERPSQQILEIDEVTTLTCIFVDGHVVYRFVTGLSRHALHVMCNISYYSIIFPAEGVTTHLFPCSDCHAVMWSLYACCIGKELGEPLLGWPVLFKIVKGIAEGIAYIHKSKYAGNVRALSLGI